jgi:hypothetical protein
MQSIHAMEAAKTRLQSEKRACVARFPFTSIEPED